MQWEGCDVRLCNEGGTWHYNHCISRKKVSRGQEVGCMLYRGQTQVRLDEGLLIEEQRQAE